LYGPHVNGTRIDPNERSALANLAAAAEQAYDTLRIRSTNVRRLSELLERIDGKVPYDEVHHYLADQVIQTVSEQTRIALLACAVIPQPTAEDIVYATGDENDIDRLKYMLSSSSLIRLNQDGVYTLHPLIRHALLTRARDKRKDMLLRCARAWEERQEHARAARLYSAAGMRQDAAHARAAASVTT
jgi:ATP/maltotriose-dependent transcriptional regulator MalT